MTVDPALLAAVNVSLSDLNQLDLTALRAAALPILDAWARAVQLPDASGTLRSIDPAAGHSDVPILVDTDGSGNTVITDFAYQATDPDGHTFWKLASGAPVKDPHGDVIDAPSFDDIMARDGRSGARISAIAAMSRIVWPGLAEGLQHH
jgi:hypothetical protein